MRSLSDHRPAFALLSISLLMGSMPVAARVTAQPVVGHGSPAQGIRPDGADPSLGTPTPEGLSATEWTSIHDAYEANRHTVYPTADGYQARNPGQRWVTHFDRRGFTTHPDGAEWTWGLQLEGYGFGGQECVVSAPWNITSAGTRVEYDWDDNFQEWWINDPRGLEHGFTIRRRPPMCEPGPLMITLSVSGDLQECVEGNALSIGFRDADGNLAVAYAGLTVSDANGRKLAARFEQATHHVCLAIEEASALYPLTVDPIAQNVYLKASNASAGDLFGLAIAVSGNTVLIGAPGEDSNARGVNGNEGDNSAPDSGAAYVFVRSGGGWVQQAYLKASNAEANDKFGGSVSISGDIAVITAAYEDSSALGVNGNQADNSASGRGAAYVFVRNGNSWSQEAYLKSTNAASSFGISAAVAGETVVVGAEADHSVAFYGGGAFVFVRNGGGWTSQAYLRASNTAQNASFGDAVSIWEDTIVVGAPYESNSATGVNGNQANGIANGSGAAYVFTRDATGSWSQETYLKASNTSAFANFGWALSATEGLIIVGSPYENSNASGVNGNQMDHSLFDAGAAYIFGRSGTTWIQQAYLKASPSRASSYFGGEVSAASDRVVVGASTEPSNAVGINGDAYNNLAPQAGAAYVFSRQGTTWSQEAYVKASNTRTGALFGRSVALSSEMLAVGSPYESSNSTGVGANQTNTSAPQAGAAYVFALPLSQLSYCAGDGSDAPCPCNNPGVPGRGCNNTANTNGASLTGNGYASVSADELVLSVEGAIPYGPGLFYQGSSTANTTQPFGVAFGNGLRCAGGVTSRLEVRFADATGICSSTVPIHTLGSVAAGDLCYYQFWYRDSLTVGACGAGYNLSNAVGITWGP